MVGLAASVAPSLLVVCMLVDGVSLLVVGLTSWGARDGGGGV